MNNIKIDVSNPDLKICANCVHALTCGYYIDDIYVNFCTIRKISVYSDTLYAEDCKDFDSLYVDD